MRFFIGNSGYINLVFFYKNYNVFATLATAAMVKSKSS